MAKRPHPQGTTTNPHAGPWTTCDRCGKIFSMNRMQFQYDYMGGSSPQNLGLLVCDSGCLDDLNYQQKLLILPPDPQPFFNTRPENYVVDETNWLVTQDDDIITTQSNDPLIQNIPSPTYDAATSNLTCSISASGGSVATVYLDLFVGNPASGGTSVLALITGSSVRTNVASSLTTVLGIAQNTSPIVIAAASASTTNVSYVGIYDAPSGGALLMSGAVGVSGPSITIGNPVQFDSLGLQIDIN